jgi:hypothetical protein
VVDIDGIVFVHFVSVDEIIEVVIDFFEWVYIVNFFVELFLIVFIT